MTDVRDLAPSDYATAKAKLLAGKRDAPTVVDPEPLVATLIRSTSSTAAAPVVGPIEARHARDMSPEEYKAARARFR